MAKDPQRTPAIPTIDLPLPPGAETRDDASFVWASYVAAAGRSAICGSIALLVFLVHLRLQLDLPLQLLAVVGVFELLINQPYPFSRRLVGSYRRLYVFSLLFDVIATAVAAFAIGGIANQLVFFLFLFLIALVGASAGRLLTCWAAFLASLASVLLALAQARGLVPPPPLIVAINVSDAGVVASIQVFCYCLLAVFVGLPSSKLLRVMYRYRRAELELHAQETELVERAFHDPLTGIANRALFLQHLSHALQRARRQQETLAVLFIDLDRFKQVNDTLGHAAGDALLIAVTRRLSNGLRAEDTFARFGGDEFMILIEHVERPEAVISLANDIVNALRSPFDVKGHEVTTGASVGIALETPYGTSLEPSDLLRHADIAVHRAKAAGRSCSVTFDGTMNQRVVERAALEEDLRHAIARDELRLYYQPLVRLETGRLAGAEALLRWWHPKRGLLLPTEFIGIAEETGLLVSIGEWVLNQACREARAWRQRNWHDEPLKVSVNLSARQFQQPNLVQQVLAVLKESGLAPSSLELEITETTMMQDVESAIGVLDALKGLGVRLAIDDFGTGYSSLSYVRNFAVHTLKVDQGFIQGLGQDTVATAIVEAVTTLAHALRSTVTAEGIETVAQLEAVRALHCDFAQGNYFSAALPAKQFQALLTASGVRAAVADTNVA
jgi:diguanylate cyclase (GGDEF)-like protein